MPQSRSTTPSQTSRPTDEQSTSVTVTSSRKHGDASCLPRGMVLDFLKRAKKSAPASVGHWGVQGGGPEQSGVEWTRGEEGDSGG